MPLSIGANNFGSNKNELKNETNIQLSSTLNFQNSGEVLSSYVEPKIIINAILNYFDEGYDTYNSSFYYDNSIMKCYTERAVDKHPKIW